LDSDGRVVFKFKRNASGVSDGKTWQSKPPKLYDSAAVLIVDPGPDFRIGNGSIVRVSFQVRPYFVQKAGISLRLRALQIVRLVDFDDAKYFGLENEDDGEGYHYSAPGSAPEPLLPPAPGSQAQSPESQVNVTELEDDDRFAPVSKNSEPISDTDIPF
jgi:hypothetical protein